MSTADTPPLIRTAHKALVDEHESRGGRPLDEDEPEVETGVCLRQGGAHGVESTLEASSWPALTRRKPHPLPRQPYSTVKAGAPSHSATASKGEADHRETSSLASPRPQRSMSGRDSGRLLLLAQKPPSKITLPHKQTPRLPGAPEALPLPLADWPPRPPSRVHTRLPSLPPISSHPFSPRAHLRPLSCNVPSPTHAHPLRHSATRRLPPTLASHLIPSHPNRKGIICVVVSVRTENVDRERVDTE
ncbi:hypothetical protein B0H12DRAFT_1331309 [Mycena haematopus]|nr:hypothetical protein B0H12DRAFT_1331309 [Mycena haematopus]